MRTRALAIELVFLPVGTPHLNPIEAVWKSLKWTIPPIAVSSTAENRSLVRTAFQDLTENVSFATDRSKRFINIQKLS